MSGTSCNLEFLLMSGFSVSVPILILIYSIKMGVILTFYTFCSNKKPEAKPRAFYSQNV